jgi:toxin CptA
MSIAASVVVKPSRRLLMLVTCLCLGVIAVAACVAFGLVGELSLWPKVTLTLTCTILAGTGFAQNLSNRKNYHLDISGVGQIRLHEVIHAKVDPKTDGILVILLADSTLWPWLLVLRLQDEGGRVYVLPILPDSLPAASFRSVAVACRWIAAHRFSAEN